MGTHRFMKLYQVKVRMKQKSVKQQSCEFRLKYCETVSSGIILCVVQQYVHLQLAVQQLHINENVLVVFFDILEPTDLEDSISSLHGILLGSFSPQYIFTSVRFQLCHHILHRWIMSNRSFQISFVSGCHICISVVIVLISLPNRMHEKAYEMDICIQEMDMCILETLDTC